MPDLVLGPGMGFLLQQFYEETKRAMDKNKKFDVVLTSLQNTIISVKAKIDEISKMDKEHDDYPKQEIVVFLEQLEIGKELVSTCADIPSWHKYKRRKYAKRLVDMDSSLRKLLEVQFQAEQVLYIKKMLSEMAAINKKSDRMNIQIPVGVSGGGESSNAAAADQSSDDQTELLKDDEMQVIVVSAPGGAGKTTLIKKLCADDQVKGAAIHSPSSPISHVPAKPESLPMKCQWQKGKLIGSGTFGSVYVARNRETGALCAMKEVKMLTDHPKSAECIKQLEQEIEVLSNLKHPNIVQYYGSEIVEDKFYIYLEYVHPGSINKYVREHCGAMTESIVRNFTLHILSGLAYLHSKRTIHRDIKGANLLVDASGVVKLADFGVAKHLTGQAADLSLKGSPHWIAPELMIPVMQRDNNSNLAPAVDIWSLGCTIIEMYTGKPPWSEFEGVAAMFKVMKDTPSIPESLSAEAKDFLRCCFQRNPADRPSASKLLEHRFLKNS